MARYGAIRGELKRANTASLAPCTLGCAAIFSSHYLIGSADSLVFGHATSQKKEKE